MKSAEESSSDEECDDSEDVEEDISDPDVHSSLNRSTHNGVSHPRIFQLSFVNIYGNAEVNRLNDDNKQIKFGREFYSAFYAESSSIYSSFASSNPNKRMLVFQTNRLFDYYLDQHFHYSSFFRSHVLGSRMEFKVKRASL
jgi:hypothetical protein